MGRKEWYAGRLPTPVPLVEIAGERRTLIEHHLGVRSYTEEMIRVRVRYGEIQVCGRDLCIARMTREQLVICGSIDAVQLVRIGEKNGR